MMIQMRKNILAGLAFACLAMSAGAACAGKARTQFAVTLKVISRCDITVPDRFDGRPHGQVGRASRQAARPPSVNTHCTHGGLAQIRMGGAGRSGPAIVYVSANGQLRSKPGEVGSGTYTDSGMRAANAANPVEDSQAPVSVVTVVF